MARFDMGYGGSSLNSPLTVGGSVTIFDTLRLGNVAGADLKVRGNFYNAGTFIPNGRAVIFEGSSTQFYNGTVDTTFDGLTINNTSSDSGGISMQRNATVNGVLTLTDGMLKVQGFNLILGPNASVSGGSTASMVVTDSNGSAAGDGFVCKSYTGAGSFTFPVGDTLSPTDYSPATLNFTSGTFASAQACVRVTDAKQPNNTSTTNYLTRYWTATQSGISSFSANTTFTYVEADVVGTESAIYTGQWDGALWTVLNPANTAANTIGGTVSSFSDFTGSELSALAVTLASFAAQGETDRVVVTWETVSELDNAGFNLYRSDNAAGPQTLLAYRAVAGAGQRAGLRLQLRRPGRRAWPDLVVLAGGRQPERRDDAARAGQRDGEHADGGDAERHERRRGNRQCGAAFGRDATGADVAGRRAGCTEIVSNRTADTSACASAGVNRKTRIGIGIRAFRIRGSP